MKSNPTLKKRITLLAVCVIALAILVIIFFPRISGRKSLKNANIILITLDTLRYDFVSAYGFSQANTPNLDKIAAEGILFENCIAQTPLTLPSHTTILSGTYPLYHQVRDNTGFSVPAKLELVSETLKNAGYSTYAFVGSFALHSKWGINQGFDHFDDNFDLARYKDTSFETLQKRAEDVLKEASNWLETRKKTKFFTWIHLYDPHTPYDPPKEFRDKYPKNLYRGEVEYMDQELGKFFNYLKKAGLYDNSIIVLAADHGEDLGEHGELTHGFFIYDATVRVPLIIKIPSTPGAKKVKDLVELADITPTLLDLAGVNPSPAFQGESLSGLIWNNKKRNKKTAYCESFYGRMHFACSELYAYYYDHHWKYIEAPERELYDLEQDRHESKNLFAEKTNDANKAKFRLKDFIKEKSKQALMPENTVNLSPEDRKKLASLGYLTTVTTPTTGPLPDPKKRLSIYLKLTSTRELFQQEKYSQIIELMRDILKEEPNLVEAYLHLGNAYTSLNMHAEALKCYYTLLEKKLDYNDVAFNIINALISLEQYDQGIAEAQRLIKIFPGDFQFYIQLGRMYLLKGDHDRAIDMFKKSIEIEAVNSRAFINLARVYILKKDFVKAESYLNQARDLTSQQDELYYMYALVEEGKGNTDRAMDYYKKDLEINNKSYKSAFNLGVELRKKGDFSEAGKYLKKAIDANPSFNIPYFIMAMDLVQVYQDLDGALEYCLKGIKITPQDPYTVQGYMLLADIYKIKNNLSKSAYYLREGNRIKQSLPRRVENIER